MHEVVDRVREARVAVMRNEVEQLGRMVGSPLVLNGDEKRAREEEMQGVGRGGEEVEGVGGEEGIGQGGEGTSAGAEEKGRHCHNNRHLKR